MKKITASTKKMGLLGILAWVGVTILGASAIGAILEKEMYEE